MSPNGPLDETEVDELIRRDRQRIAERKERERRAERALGFGP